MKRQFAILVALVLAPMTGMAEVRLQAGGTGPELVVQQVARGVWTPRGVPDVYTVNPDGDLLGDGFPSQATNSGHLVAAWQRPAHGALVVLSAISVTNAVSSEVPTVEAVGDPVITGLDSGSLVTWQGGHSVPVINAVLVSGRGVSPPITLLSGRLLGVHRVGDSVQVVAFDAVGSTLNVGTLPALWEPNPIPVPEVRVPLFRTFGAVPLEVTPPPEFVTSPDTWLPCVEERGSDVLLAWQAGRNVVGRVILDATGVEGSGEFFRGPNGSCQAVLNAAERH